MEIEKKIDELQGLVTEFKKANDKELSEIKAKGHAAGETTAKVAKIDEAIVKLQDEIKGLQTAVNRPGFGGGTPTDEKAERKAKVSEAFTKYMKTGDGAELKALSVGTDADGGYLVREEIYSEMSKKIHESSPVRQLATVQTISSNELEIRFDEDLLTSGWVAETAARPATATPQFNAQKIAVHEMYAKPEATQMFLEDAAINVESWLAEKTAESFAKLEATAFISGSGSGQPKGLISYAAGTAYNQVEQVASGVSGSLNGDSLQSLVGALKSMYKQNASFLLKRATLTAIRKLKDLNGQYIWQPGLQPGQPDFLLGYPVYEADDMPAVAASALPIVFGDIKKAYIVIDRVGMSVLRDPFSNKPYIQFYARKRVSGAVKVHEAVKVLAIDA